MKQNKIILWISVFFPIVCLLALTLYKKSITTFGQKFVFEIEGYDPRDLLSGHYLTYRVKYKSTDSCSENPNNTNNVCVCLNDSNNKFVNECDKKELANCKAFLKGRCDNGQFTANIERYYIPEGKSYELDQKVRAGKGKIRVAVNKVGTGIVEDLFFEEN